MIIVGVLLWGASIVIFGMICFANGYASGQREQGVRGYDLGVKHEQHTQRREAIERGFACGDIGFESVENFRWKTSSEICDEVIAERKAAIEAQQREQQDRFRELWGSAVYGCEEVND